MVDMQGRTDAAAGKFGARLRVMEPTDAPAVAALEAEIFSDPWSEALYEETLAGGRYDCRVLVCENESGAELVCGYFCGQRILDEAEVHRVAVAPAFRGRGYGQALLEDFLTRLRLAGVTAVFLEVRAGNEPALALYKKTGFAPVGTRRDYYRNPTEDAIMMQKRF